MRRLSKTLLALVASLGSVLHMPSVAIAEYCTDLEHPENCHPRDTAASDPEIEELYKSNDSFKQSDRPSDGGGNLDGSAGDALRRREEGLRIGRAAGPGNNFGDLSDTPLSNHDNPGIANLTTPNSWCKDSANGCVIGEENLPENEPGSKLATFNFLSPMSGVTDALNSKVYVNQITGNIASPLGVLAATMRLTEPGLASGMMDSMQVAGMATMARLQADQNVFARAQVYKGTGEIFASAYDAKIARERANGKTWLEAQSRALGGERSGTASDIQKFDSESPDSMIDFESDPSHPSSAETRSADLKSTYSYSGKFIRGLDYVFNLEMARAPAGVDRDKHKTSLLKLRQSFEKFVGDIELQVGTPTSTADLSPAESTTNQNGAGVVALSIKRIQPSEKPEVFFRNLVIDRYKDLHAILSLKCRFDTGAPPDSGSGGTATAPKNVFWSDIGGVHQLMIRTSTSGFRPPPKLLEALYGMFMDEIGWDLEPGACAALSTSNGKPSDIFNIVSKSNGRDIATRSNERIRSIFFLAEHIAYGQFLGTLAQAEQVVQQSSTGSYSSLVKENLLGLIYGVAGTKEIDLAIDRNNQELRGVALEIGDRYRVRNAESSNAITLGGGGSGGRAPDMINGQ